MQTRRELDVPEVTVLECDRTGARAASADVRRTHVRFTVDGSDEYLRLDPCLSAIARTNLMDVVRRACAPPVRRGKKDELPAISERRRLVWSAWPNLPDAVRNGVRSALLLDPENDDGKVEAALNEASPAILQAIAGIIARAENPEPEPSA